MCLPRPLGVPGSRGVGLPVRPAPCPLTGSFSCRKGLGPGLRARPSLRVHSLCDPLILSWDPADQEPPVGLRDPRGGALGRFQDPGWTWGGPGRQPGGSTRPRPRPGEGQGGGGLCTPTCELHKHPGVALKPPPSPPRPSWPCLSLVPRPAGHELSFSSPSFSPFVTPSSGFNQHGVNFSLGIPRGGQLQGWARTPPPSSPPTGPQVAPTSGLAVHQAKAFPLNPSPWNPTVFL